MASDNVKAAAQAIAGKVGPIAKEMKKGGEQRADEDEESGMVPGDYARRWEAAMKNRDYEGAEGAILDLLENAQTKVTK